MVALPKRLLSEPLIEVIWQAKFGNSVASSLGDLFPGVLYSELRKKYNQLSLIRLPAADIPHIAVNRDNHLRNLIKFRLEDSESPILYQIGDNTVTLNCRRPYIGWADFRTKIVDLVEILKNSGLVSKPLEHSLRYIDLFQIHNPPDLSAVRIGIHLGELDTHSKPLQLRLELPDLDCKHIVQIATPATAHLQDHLLEGSIVDLETMPMSAPDSWAGLEGQLNHLHDKSIELFFRHIITEDALCQLGPEY